MGISMATLTGETDERREASRPAGANGEDRPSANDQPTVTNQEEQDKQGEAETTSPDDHDKQGETTTPTNDDHSGGAAQQSGNTPTPPPTAQQHDIPETNHSQKGKLVGITIGALVVLAIMVSVLVLLFDTLWPVVPGVIGLYLVLRLALPRLITSPPGRTVPTEGKPARLYGILSSPALGLHYIPRLSPAEALALRQKEAWERQQEELEVAKAEHIRLRQEQTEAVEMVFLGPVGGVGKGTSTTNTAALAAETYPAAVQVLDSRDGVGNIAARFGLSVYKWTDDRKKINPDATVTIRQGIELNEQDELKTGVNNQHLIRFAPTIKGLLAVVGSDTEDATGKTFPPIDVKMLGKFMDGQNLTYTMSFHEGANVRGSLLDLELLKRSRMPAFVHRPSRHYSATELGNCLKVYREDERLAAKIRDHGLLYVLDVDVTTDTREKYGRLFDFDPSRVVLVSADPYYINEGYEEIVIDPDTGEEKLRTYDTDSAPPVPIVSVAGMPVVDQISILRGLNAGLRTLLSNPTDNPTPTANTATTTEGASS